MVKIVNGTIVSDASADPEAGGGISAASSYVSGATSSWSDWLRTSQGKKAMMVAIIFIGLSFIHPAFLGLGVAALVAGYVITGGFGQGRGGGGGGGSTGGSGSGGGAARRNGGFKTIGDLPKPPKS
mmetsp:Transcript_24667/g.62442  ORF Transcript_24667/g.62442 Transcript_24667/m.62442 type:complete len:126 (-) Transcript_24667:866-1243(-)|eukprot:CAMPEP_0113878618 /NCGR_PEP_ID=MMETSP0780_2-20120614/6789_1 /TAXON_ID=652834 /ORGANISM="Palpitomonas bilix" /LENGTH=125 /DNA_ID=CAMNT_0000865121 /DNA_START=110 /DNA_END=487 /DNA_ORIENTATION=- /assembly_acc=CAM_ASM_000599